MKRDRLVPVLLAAALLVGAVNLGAFAATGGPLLLGKGNTATKTTKLKTTGSGAALTLTSKANKPPLAVSNSTKVTGLNADLVDGLDSSALKTRSYVFNLSATNIANANVLFALTGLPPGRYLANFSVTAVVASANSFECYLASGTGGTLDVPVSAAGIEGGGGTWSVNGGGFVDNTSAAHRFGCTGFGATNMTIPNSFAPASAATLVMTAVDVAPAVAVNGGGSATP